ncbi:hypothetical protein [Slackia piriformis]|uniref:hypothetical protein n=1 Tax=Slackia piriformis TaxID=626934 RepID=UPI0023F4B408|nr:hypothetical protein [Slackia piriformis]
MSSFSVDDAFDPFEEFDPLAADDEKIDQQDMDDDNPLDTVDFPTVRNMPESMQSNGVYTPERQGGAQEALLALMDRNPARRPVMLAMLDYCAEGAHASALSEYVDGLQQNNRSVYAPMTLARMLERAGGLVLDMPETTEQHEDVEENVEYLEIKEHVDPVWTTTEAGKNVFAELSQGAAFRDLVLDRDSKYLDVYRAVMQALHEKPCGKNEIDELVDSFPIVAEPRRFGGHFIDILERVDAIAWKDGAWTLSGLGEKMLREF